MKKNNLLKAILAALGRVALLISACFSGCGNRSPENQAGSVKTPTSRNIASAEQMAQIGVGAWLMSDDYILRANIELAAWTPIGTKDNPFTGTFNGNGNTITILNFLESALLGEYLGIFGYAAHTGDNPNAGHIYNLKVLSRINNYAANAPDTQYVGALVGWADTGVTLETITVTGALGYGSPSNIHVGGIAGYLKGASLVNTGNPLPAIGVAVNTMSTMTNYSGGAVGYGKNATITGISTTAPVTVADGAVNTSAGGVIGYATGSTITNCHATGDISVKIQHSAIIYVGGLAGYAIGGSITQCHTTGKALALSNYPYAGGLVGYNYNGSNISQSYATGDVSATGNNKGDGSYPYAGGLAGYNSGANTKIENCYARGNVAAKGAGDTCWTGGIAGANANDAVISKTYATGSVTATALYDPTASAANTGAIAGGIVGYSYFSAPVAQNSLALNDTIKNVGPTSTYIKRHRVEGSNDGGASRINNMGSGAIVFDPSYTPVSRANGPDGTTTVAQPARTVYTGLGWDFPATGAGIWKAGTDGYPVFQWQ